ncbi:uncharacterized protein [Nerophis lumbriciformis]|uniref:uncharacterized protein n=1 Tax=Nerophis lumbriciformis TaxID=546530 RepID=UPI002ADF57BB|nr:uncharacterized protein LOC133617843 [Nerophis lumbriciformis]
MASRRVYKHLSGRGQARTGLRSQVSEVAMTEETDEMAGRGATAMRLDRTTMAEEHEVGWNTEESEEDVKGFENSGARRKQHRKGSRKARWSAEPPRTERVLSEPTLVNMFQDFLIGQQRREAVLVRELQELKTVCTRPSLDHSLTNQNANRTPDDSCEQSPKPKPRTRPHPNLSPQASPSRDSSPPDHHLRQGPKMLPFQQGEDIENFLVRFERIARTWGWHQSDWACRLVPLLTGKALDAYSAMEEDASNVYADLKEALLAKFDISPETYRLQFRSTYIPPGESPKETYNRLKGLYRRWIKPEQRSKEDIAELFILEQMIRLLPNEMKTWVKEHEPED